VRDKNEHDEMTRHRCNHFVKMTVALQLGLLMWQFSPELSINGDNAVYYLLGKALSQGKGYRKICVVDEPVERKYPMGTSLLIASTQFLTNTPLLAQVLMGVMGACITLLCYYLFRSSLSPPLLLACILPVAASGLLAESELVLMSETPYIVATLAALLLRQVLHRNPTRVVVFVSTMLVSIMPIHFRSVGIVFSAAWIVDELLSRNYRSALVHAALVAVTMGFYKSLSPTQSDYVGTLFLKSSYDPEMGEITAGQLLRRVVRNANLHLGVIIPKSLFPFSRPSALVLRRILTWFLLASAFVGWIRSLGSRHRISALYVLFYMGIVLVWPIPSERRITCILPFLLLFTVLGLDAVLHASIPIRKTSVRRLFGALRSAESLISRRSQKLALGLITVVVVGFNVQYRIANPHRSDDLTPDWVNFYDCAHWVRRNTPKNAIVMSRKPSLFYIRARRKGCMYPYSHDVDEVIEAMERMNVTHVVFDNFGWTRTTAKYLYPAIMSYPNRFEVVYVLKNPDTYVLRFKETK